MPQGYEVIWSGEKERQGACRSILGLEQEIFKAAPKLDRHPHPGARLPTLTAADQLLLDGEDDAC